MSDAQQKRAREITLIKRAMAVTSVYMLAEIIIGYQFNVLSLVADSYHMMNDIAAFIVQLYADELGNLDRRHAKDSTAFSFGFGRVEILANLIQGTLLLALCLTLCLESVQRFYGPETIALPPIVVGMGVAGLVWNIIMFRLFEEAHHGHAHSLAHPLRYRQRLGNAAVQGPFRLARAASSRSSVEFSPGKSPWSKIPKAQIKAAFQPQNSLAIHAFADAIGNIAVIIDGLGSWLFGPKSGKTSGIVKTFKGISYLDPICSLVVVYLILTHAFPLVTKSSFFLMHAFDPVKTSSIKRALNNQNWVPGSLRAYLAVELEDLHIWSMNDKSRFATVRILVSPRGSYHLSALELVKLEEAAKGVMGEVGPPDQITVELRLSHSPLPPPEPSSVSRRASQAHSHASHALAPPAYTHSHSHDHARNDNDFGQSSAEEEADSGRSYDYPHSHGPDLHSHSHGPDLHSHPHTHSNPLGTQASSLGRARGRGSGKLYR